MLAVYAGSIDRDDPLAGLVVGERPEPAVPPGWTVVQVRAASVNHHDVWSLRGVGLPAERLPMILGCDAAGIDEDGREVLVHSVVSSPDFVGDETMDPARSLLSERYQGTFAERVAVPRRNLVPKPPELSMAEAACLPTAWLTAYRMLATRSSLRAGDTVLVQGAGGGVATAAIMLGRAMGLRVWATSRDEARRVRAVEIGAHEAFGSGARLPERVDAVIESVGAATWDHSLKSLRPGGEIIVTGATSGANPPADLQRVFFRQLSVIGSTMGTRDELRRLVALCAATGLRPLVERTLPMAQAPEAIAEVARGEVFGKIVLTLAG
jgi:NADPH:quinone reductase-like Zn-dependent oxidoreductase